MTLGTIKLYMSEITSRKELRHIQQHIISILEGHKINFEKIDITDPANEEEKNYMREHSLVKDGDKFALPPQIFNGDEYCGDYDHFYQCLEDDELYGFLKLADKKVISQATVAITGGRTSDDFDHLSKAKQEKDEASSEDNDISIPEKNGANGEDKDKGEDKAEVD